MAQPAGVFSLFPTTGRPQTHAQNTRTSSVRSRSSIAKVRLSQYDAAPEQDDDPPPPMPGQADFQQAQQARQTGQSSQSSQSSRPPPLRSIFPQYNPDVTLDEQQYFPTQTSPTRIPRSVISRPLYSPVEQVHAPTPRHRQQPSLTITTSIPNEVPEYVESQRPTPPRVWPGSRTEAPNLPVPSSTEDLRAFWRIASGWKAGPSEGRVFCLRLSCDADAPVYRLSSASQQPFYRLRLDPTSVSAKVTLARHDPARPFKAESGGDETAPTAPSRNGSLLDVGGSGDSVVDGATDGSVGTPPPNPLARFDTSKHWQEAMVTTLEEEARRHAPQDGLVALLYPTAAARTALARPHDTALVATAERECARLVWDDDTQQYFVVHPALALPFGVTIERSSTWSRTAYTLEHLESPQHLARLTRDGTGAGFLEIDTGLASKVDAVYLVDVVVAALVLVAHSDRQWTAVEQFAPPPDVHVPRGASPRGSLVTMVMMGATGRSSRQSNTSRAPSVAPPSQTKRSRGLAFFGRRPPKAATRPGRTRMADAYDVDLESQTSIDLSGKMFEMGPVGPAHNKRKKRNKAKAKADKADEKDRVPGVVRVLAALVKCCFWCVSMVVRALLAVARGLFRCIFHEKL